ncbi:DMT family transporter [Proteinivorax hydrogeniformans]|uniref:DMT family transporter n=1 Tax=Proteinivorax hydrogeniformans TaxID=1826727 RepID=A0AAU8HSM7_9FIRM
MIKAIQKNIHFFTGLGYATIFGFSFMFTAEILEYISSPFHLLSFRFIFAFLTMTIVQLALGSRLKVKKVPISKKLLLLVFFQPFLYFSAETTGVRMTSSSEAGMMIALIPIFVAIFSAIFLKEHPKKIQIPFILSSVSGVVFIAIMQGRADGEVISNLAGIIVLLVAVLAGAGFNITSRSLSVSLTPFQRTYSMMGAGAVIFTSIAVIQQAVRGELTSFFQPLTYTEVLFPLLYLGILSSVVAFFLINFTLSRVSAAQGAVFANLVTVISITAGVFIRGESFYYYHLIGAIFIITGVLGTNLLGKQTPVSTKSLYVKQKAS